MAHDNISDLQEIPSPARDFGDGAQTTGSGMPGGVGLAADVVIIAAFLAVVGLPVADLFLGLDPSPASGENRYLAPMPLAIKALGDGDEGALDRFNSVTRNLRDLPRQLKFYANDHFGFRNLLIRQHAFFKLNVLGVSSAPGVLLGKRDSGTADDPGGQWLYYIGVGGLEHVRASAPFSHAQLEQWRSVLEQRRGWLEQKGIRYLFVVTPEKHTAYPEYLPSGITRAGEITRTDQFISDLREKSRIEVVDTRVALWKARRTEPHLRLFHRTDSHWNDLGAFTAYEAIVQRLAGWRPSIRPMVRTEFDIDRRIEAGGDLARMLGVGDQFREVALNLKSRSERQRPVEKDDDQDRVRMGNGQADQSRLLMFGDSFGTNLIPLLARHFESALLIRNSEFDVAAIDEQKPDLVISEIAERRFVADPPERFVVPDASLVGDAESSK